MIDERELLEQELERFTPDPDMLGRVVRRRERKLRRQRVAAGALGIGIAIAIAVAAGAIIGDTDREAGVTPTPSPAPGFSERTIFSLNPNTEEVTPLVSGATRVANAERSPVDGRIAYERVGTDGRTRLYILELDGTERLLTELHGGAFDPTWSPDGTRIAFSGSRSPGRDTDIWVIFADGSTPHLLAGTDRPDGDPDWSPDGSRIAFHARDDFVPGEKIWETSLGSVWIATVRTGEVVQLRHRPSAYGAVYGVVDPVWSPDGRQIAFCAVEAIVNARIIETSLWVARADGSHGRRVTSSTQLENPSWSPDGRSIAFERPVPASLGAQWDAGTDGELLIVDVQTGSIRRFETDATFNQPSWGADGILVTTPTTETTS